MPTTLLALQKLREDDFHKFQASLGFMPSWNAARHCLKQTTHILDWIWFQYLEYWHRRTSNWEASLGYHVLSLSQTTAILGSSNVPSSKNDYLNWVFLDHFPPSWRAREGHETITFLSNHFSTTSLFYVTRNNCIGLEDKLEYTGRQEFHLWGKEDNPHCCWVVVF